MMAGVGVRTCVILKIFGEQTHFNSLSGEFELNS